jgi:Tol biopolymer transport system component
LPLTPGTRLGAYEVTAKIGEGGMGQVYRARDTRLGRDVALKILPDAFAADLDRIARFEREARTLAALNHPGIAQIFGLEQAGGVHALAMELVTGDDLSERIGRGAIPVHDALPIAKQIAEALEAAHDQSIIHRDLKPANIKVKPDGLVKVLDFGLAKLLDDERSRPTSPSVSQSPTLSSPAVLTMAGVILGTAAYMSPEQATGKAADARSDIWAFGVVLYEMLAGKSAFPGETMVEVLGAVLKSEPNWMALPADTPIIIRSLLRQCLRKDRNRRLRAIADARFQIEEALNEPAAVLARPVRAARNTGERLMWTAALVLTAAAAGLGAWIFRVTPIDAPEVRLQIVTPPTDDLTAFAMSPDGRQVVFAATTTGKSQLWLRALEAETARPLPGTEGAAGPFWSPDGRSIGFFAGQQLKRVETAGGNARALTDAPGSLSSFGGTWGADGAILYVTGPTSPLLRVSAHGGKPGEAIPLQGPAEGSHRFPSFLPDGRHFLFYVTGTPDVQGIHIGSLDSKGSRRVVESDSAAVFALPDVVLFRREDSLLAQRLDRRTYEPIGDPFPVVSTVASSGATFASIAVSASRAGPFAYRAAAMDPRQLIWFTRTGKQLGTVGDHDPSLTNLAGLRLSPDGRSVGLTRRVGGNVDVWVTETARGVARRLTSDAAVDGWPIWSPDSSRVAFQSSRIHGGGIYDLFVQRVEEAGSETLLLGSSENKNVWDWSRDGRFVLYSHRSRTTVRDLWALPLDGDKKPFAVVQTASDEFGGTFSPDRGWIAYQSNETGRHEIYVQPFPGPGRSTLVSTTGGSFPRWRGDGREIFYTAPGDRLMAVPMTLQKNRLAPSAPAVMLFTMRPNSSWDVALDGQRFLVNTPVNEATTPPITVVLNWKAQR